MKYVIPLFTILFIACNTNKKVPVVSYHKEGVLFYYPEDWAITEEERFDGGFYLSCEKKGLNSSGLFTCSYVDFILDEAAMIELFIDEMKSNPLYQSSALDFYSQTDTVFSGYPCVRSDFRASVIGIEHHGSIHCFQACQRTIAVLFQEATEDIEANQQGFETVAASFKCDPNAPIQDLPIEEIEFESDSTEVL
jgi:hypothetical protein